MEKRKSRGKDSANVSATSESIRALSSSNEEAKLNSALKKLEITHKMGGPSHNFGLSSLNFDPSDLKDVVLPDMWLIEYGYTKMEFIRGTPWSFYFKRLTNSSESIDLQILQHFKNQSLIPIPDAVFLGRLICANKNGSWFRGFVSKISSPYKVIVFDIDRGDLEEIDRARVFRCPESIKSIPPQVIMCSLLPEDSFSREIWCEELQKNFMMTMLDCTFEVNVIRCCDSARALRHRLVRDLQFKGFRFYVSAKGRSNFYSEPADFNEWLVERLLPEVKENLKQKSSPDLSLFCHINPFESLIPTSVSLPRSDSEKTIIENQENPLPLQEKCNAFIEIDEPDEDEIPDLRCNYQPQEQDYCHLNFKLGFCPKILCDKKHLRPSTKWTEDELPIEKDLFNLINLPMSGSTIQVKVLSIQSTRMIYVDLLDPKYSDIGEGSSTFETFQDLDGSMNDMRNLSSFSCLKVLPCIGELVIALDPQDERFKRGRVFNAVDHVCSVFLIDFGTYITVKCDSLMHIPQKYLHLPQQAVLATLEGVKDDCPKKFWEKYVGHVLWARVIDSDPIEGAFTIQLLTQEKSSNLRTK